MFKPTDTQGIFFNIKKESANFTFISWIHTSFFFFLFFVSPPDSHLDKRVSDEEADWEVVFFNQ